MTPRPALDAVVSPNVERPNRLLTADDLAERWQVSKAHVYRLAREGLLPAGVLVQIGRYYRFNQAGVEAFEAQGGVGVAA